MAKNEVNKSQAIRDALKANPNKSPSEIAEALQSKGIKVNAQYVSVIKSAAKAKRHKTSKRTLGRTGRAAKNGSPFSAALEFIKASGGLTEAQETLSAIEEISRTVR